MLVIKAVATLYVFMVMQIKLVVVVVVRWKLLKGPLRGTKVLFCGPGLKFYSPLRKKHIYLH